VTNELLVRENRISELEERVPFPEFLNSFHESNGPRNYLFELVMASTLKAAGFGVRIDSDEDVYFEISGVPASWSASECFRYQG
jgi:hypothetical protein